jgi:hypothetical protein
MRKGLYSVVGLTTLAVLLGTYPHVFAQEQSKEANPPASAPVSRSAIAPTLHTNQVLQGSHLVHGTRAGTFFPAGTFTAVDRLGTVQCPGTSGNCTIAANMWVQTGLSSTSPNNYAVCLFVDGNSVDSSDTSNGCHYTEDTPSTGSFIEGSGLNQLSGVSPGLHTVQTFLYTNNGTPVYNFNISYQVYKP